MARVDPSVYPHLDIYPKGPQINEALEHKEVDIRFGKAVCLTADYPNMIICKWVCHHIFTDADICGRPRRISLPGNISDTGHGGYLENEVLTLTHEVIIRRGKLREWLGAFLSDG